MSSGRLRVLIVDDSFIVRSGLRANLALDSSLEVVGEATTGREGVSEAARLRPDVVLMDVRMPGQDGIAATRDLVAAWPQARVLVLTWSEDGENLVSALRAGAKGYLVHGRYTGQELVAAIHAVAEGGALISPFLTPYLLEAFRQGEGGRPGDALTAREREILDLIRSHHTNREIARRLGLSEKTVKNHINNIYFKLRVPDRRAAALYPLRPE